MPKKTSPRRSARGNPPPQLPLFKAVIKRLIGLFQEELPVTEYFKGKPTFDVVGVAPYQSVLEAICGGRSSKAHRLTLAATVVPELKAGLTRVDIQGRTVGSLKPADAKHLAKQLERAGVWPCALKVTALIQGGRRKKNGEEEDFSVKVGLPPKPEKPKPLPPPLASSAPSTPEGDD